MEKKVEEFEEIEEEDANKFAGEVSNQFWERLMASLKPQTSTMVGLKSS